MKRFLLLSIVILLSILGVRTQSQAQQSQGTKIIFYIEHQIEQPNDYVEISIQIKETEESLQKAIDSAADTVKAVEQLVVDYCKTYAKDKKDCKEVVETSQYEIDPIYQLVRKVPTFVAFSVTHETTAKIQNVKHIGKLVDDILKCRVSKINSFEWKPLEQVDNEQLAVFQGIEQANVICEKVGLKLSQVVSVSEVTEYDQEQEQQEKEQEEGQQGEGEDEEEQQQEDETIVYRFEVICEEKGGKKK